ncbi:MAG: TerB family tellurite resistance protein [Sulfitobacter sp.]|nr:TerB family tellurite resistance protein [Sulfitobacter sp.]
MFERLFPRRKPQPKPLPQPNAQLALGALLVRVAFADREYKAAEISQIDRILSRTFDIGPIEAAKLRATCEALERDAPGTPEFARILREEVDYADRKALGEAMWSVATADGHSGESEEIQLVAIEVALGLTDVDIAEGRERALRGR